MNIPQVGLVRAENDPEQPKTVWKYDPHLDPALQFDVGRAGVETLIDNALASGDAAVMHAALAELKALGQPYLAWAGKAERTSFAVDTVSLHGHERIDPARVLAAVKKAISEPAAPAQPGLFDAPFKPVPLTQALDFYRHPLGWANRLVAGDSLLVMNSLLQKESMAGQVQMIYFDPPYGIKFGSTFQPFTGQRDVKDGADADLTQEPETIKAFRDTWELGIHSYPMRRTPIPGCLPPNMSTYSGCRFRSSRAAMTMARRRHRPNQARRSKSSPNAAIWKSVGRMCCASRPR